MRLFFSSNGFKKNAVDVINVIEGFKSIEISSVPIYSFLRVTMSSDDQNEKLIARSLSSKK